MMESKYTKHLMTMSCIVCRSVVLAMTLLCTCIALVCTCAVNVMLPVTTSDMKTNLATKMISQIQGMAQVEVVQKRGKKDVPFAIRVAEATANVMPKMKAARAAEDNDNTDETDAPVDVTQNGTSYELSSVAKVVMETSSLAKQKIETLVLRKSKTASQQLEEEIDLRSRSLSDGSS